MAKLTIGEFLSVLRKAKGMTQEDVGEKLEVSAKTVSSWENNRTYPDILLLPAIAELYGVSVDELIRGERDSHDENNSQKQHINDEAVKKMRKNKYARFKQKQDILTSVAAAGACFIVLFLFIASIAALVLAVVGVIAFFTGMGIIWYQNKKYLSSEGIAFTEDITEEKKQFYLSVMHGTNIRLILCILPLALAVFVLLFNFNIAGYAVNVPVLCLYCIPFCVVLALIIRQRYLISKYGNEEQKERKKSNTKLFAFMTAAFVAVVIVADFLIMNVFFGLSHDYAKDPEEKTYDTKEEFTEHLETLLVYNRVVSENKKILVSLMSEFTLKLDEAKADIKSMHESGYPDDLIVQRLYDVGEGFVLEYIYNNNKYDDIEYLGVFFKDSERDGEDELIYVQNGRIVTLYNEDGSTDMMFDLYHHYYLPDQGGSSLGVPKYPDYVYYYSDDIAFLSKYETDVYECRNGKYGIYRHVIYMVHESELRFCSIVFALAAEAVLYLIMRKKYKFIPVQMTF